MAYFNNKVIGRDFKIYIVPFDSTTTVDVAGTDVPLMTVVKAAATSGDIDALLLLQTAITSPVVPNVFYEFGELRRDSITDTLGEGNTIEGNNEGKIVLDKSGSLSFELINFLQAQIVELDTLDRSIICVLKYDTANGEAEFFPDYQFTYVESDTGGEATAIPITLNKTVSDIVDYSILLPIA